MAGGLIRTLDVERRAGPPLAAAAWSLAVHLAIGAVLAAQMFRGPAFPRASVIDVMLVPAALTMTEGVAATVPTETATSTAGPAPRNDDPFVTARRNAPLLVDRPDEDIGMAVPVPPVPPPKPVRLAALPVSAKAPESGLARTPPSLARKHRPLSIDKWKVPRLRRAVDTHAASVAPPGGGDRVAAGGRVQPTPATSAAEPARGSRVVGGVTGISPDSEGAGTTVSRLAAAGARLLASPPPEYPLRARRRGIEGRVVLSVDVLADGQLGEIWVKRSSGHGILDRAAVAAVRGWRFAPARSGGARVAARIEVPITFKLED